MMPTHRLLVPALGCMAAMALLGIAAAQRGSGGDPVNAARGAAPNLTKPASVEKAPDANGFIQRWLVLEPIPIQIRSNAQLNDSFVQRTIKTEYFAGPYAEIPQDGDKVTVNGNEFTWHAVDTSTYNVNLYHFAYALNKPTFNILFWAVTVVNFPNEMKGVRLAVGSNAASIWWVNGKEVIGIYGDRHMVIDDGVSKRLSLKKGPNIVRCAVINAPGVSDICARFLDAEDKPVKGFTVKLGEVAR
ncbi:MAG: acetylxylan esterase [Acidobacteria bacterium]|nr:acetylxylan esterase [Acidobacteriota bacterium]